MTPNRRRISDAIYRVMDDVRTKSFSDFFIMTAVF